MNKYHHSWKSPDFSTCEYCGDKDWMAGDTCRGSVTTNQIKIKSNISVFDPVYLSLISAIGFSIILYWWFK